jgi:hypothetical protein
MRFEVGDKVITKYARIRCVVIATTDLPSTGLQRLELGCSREILIRDSDMVETDNYDTMRLDEIRILAKRYVETTGRAVCIIHCKSFGYNIMEVQKARGRKNIIETIEPEKPKGE